MACSQKFLWVFEIQVFEVYIVNLMRSNPKLICARKNFSKNVGFTWILRGMAGICCPQL